MQWTEHDNGNLSLELVGLMLLKVWQDDVNTWSWAVRGVGLDGGTAATREAAKEAAVNEARQMLTNALEVLE